MKILGAVFLAAGAGLAGYAGYKYYKQRQSMGSLLEGHSDYNSQRAQDYYVRLAAISNEQKMMKLRKLNRTGTFYG